MIAIEVDHVATARCAKCNWFGTHYHGSTQTPEKIAELVRSNGIYDAVMLARAAALNHVRSMDGFDDPCFESDIVLRVIALYNFKATPGSKERIQLVYTLWTRTMTDFTRDWSGKVNADGVIAPSKNRTYFPSAAGWLLGQH